MLITKIEMENFYSHRNTSIDFDRGINMIVGPNGAGKSSILNAIRFAMFGKERDSDPVMHGTSRCYVLLEFQIEDDRYTITRSFGQKQSEREASILKNGAQMATSQDSVSREVQKIIGMDQSVFEGSVFIRQGEIDAIVNQRPRDRKDFFAQILGIEKLSKASSVVHASIQRLKVKSAELQGMTGQLQYLREELIEGQKTLKDTTNEITRLSEKIASLHASDAELQTKRIELDKKVEEIRSLQGSVEFLRSESTVEMKEISDLQKIVTNFSDVGENITSIERDPLFIQREQISRLPDLEKRLNDNKTRLLEIQEDLKRLTEMRTDLTNLDTSKAKWLKANSELSTMKEKLTTLQTGESEWIRVEQRRSDLKKKLENLKQDEVLRRPGITELFGSPEITVEILKAKNDATRSSLSRVAEEISKKKTSIGSLNNKVKDLRHDLTSLEGRSDCPLCGTKLTPDHAKEIISSINHTISTITEEIKVIDQEIGSLQNEKSELDIIQEKLSQPSVISYPDLENEIKSSIEELDRVNNSALVLEANHKKYLDLIANQLEIEKQVADLEPTARRHSELSAAIDERTKSSPEERIGELRSMTADMSAQIERIVSDSGSTNLSNAVDRSRKLVEQYQSLQKKMEEFRDASRRLEEKTKSHSSREAKIKDTEKSLESSGSLLEEHRSMMTEVEKSSNAISHAEADLSGRKREEIALNERISTLSKRISGLEESEARLGTLSKAVVLMEELKKAYSVDGIQRFIRRKASEFITNGARQFLSSFSLDFDDLEVSEDFDITILRNGPIEISALSGGERISLAIALRMSISRFLDQEERMNCFLMDEPTTYLDQERRSNLRDLLHYALGGAEVSPQVIMITHHTELTSAGDAVYEVSKKDSKSIVTSY